MRGMPRVIWVLGVASLLNDVSSEAIFPLLPVFLTSLGAPMRYIGLIEGSADALASILKVRRGAAVRSRAAPAVRRRRLHDSGARARRHRRGARALARARGAARRPHGQGHPLRAARRDDRRVGAARRSAGAPSASTARWIISARPSGPLLASVLLFAGLQLRTVFLIAAVIGMMAPIVLFFRLREQPPTWPITAGRSTRPSGGSLRRGYSPYLVACVLFALGNSSDAFLLIRAHEVGWSANGVAAAVGVPPPGEVDGGGPGRHAVGPAFARRWSCRSAGRPTRSPTSASGSRRSAGRSWCCFSSTPSITASPRARSARSSPICPTAARAGAPTASITAWSAPRRCPPASAPAWCGTAGARPGRWA